MDAELKIIEDARKLLGNYSFNLRDSTVRDYQSKISRLVARAENRLTAINVLINEALKTKKKSTWQAHRAALIYGARVSILNRLREQEILQTNLRDQERQGKIVDWETWKVIVKGIHISMEILRETQAAKLPIDGRE